MSHNFSCLKARYPASAKDWVPSLVKEEVNHPLEHLPLPLWPWMEAIQKLSLDPTFGWLVLVCHGFRVPLVQTPHRGSLWCEENVPGDVASLWHWFLNVSSMWRVSVTNQSVFWGTSSPIFGTSHNTMLPTLTFQLLAIHAQKQMEITV